MSLNCTVFGRQLKGWTRVAVWFVLLFGAFTVVMLAIPQYYHSEGGGRSRTHSDLATLAKLVQAFCEDTGRFPTEDEGLSALRSCPNGLKGWRGPHTDREIRTDEWGNAYVYRVELAGGRLRPVVLSYGADGRPGGEGRDSDVFRTCEDGAQLSVRTPMRSGDRHYRQSQESESRPYRALQIG